MKSFYKWTPILTIALLVALGVTGPANARFNPPNAAVSASSIDSQYVNSDGLIVTCPTASYTGRINGTGTTLSGRIVFSGRTGPPRLTCVLQGFGLSVDPLVRGRVTLNSRRSDVPGRRATGDVTLDSDFEASISVVALGCSVTIRGPQTFGDAWTFDVATQSLRLSVRGIRATGSGGLCGGSQTVSLTATFRVSTGGPITIS